MGAVAVESISLCTNGKLDMRYRFEQEQQSTRPSTLVFDEPRAFSIVLYHISRQRLLAIVVA